ncbi:MAG: endonuclease [Rhodospirillaceae bacterium]|nr:endonuclease [Rhodospirillaceae bacterium]MAX61506.1 endonuclease [Rhodospirillaceae bacterium]MAX61978.1 endonuclease [Rhodospirillaceae bacterium]
MWRFGILAWLFLVIPARAESEVHIVHCLKGCPTGVPTTNDLIVRQIYALSSNDATKFADWVAYLVTRETIGTSNSLNRSWKTDPELDADETLESSPDDYKGANSQIKTDRGHMVPLASFAGTVFWRDTNYLSNITPQRSDLNQGAWLDLEIAVRELAWKHNEIWVLAGTLYENTEASLPGADEPHKVPSGFWKVVALKNGRIAGFIFDQNLPRDTNFCDQLQPLEHIELRSGLDLFPEADPSWSLEVLSTYLGCNKI